MIAWMQNWDTSGCKPQGTRWFGQMTLPRELHVRDGRLIQTRSGSSSTSARAAWPTAT